MKLLFVFLFGTVTSFILYLSYRTHVIEKKEKETKKKEIIEIDKFPIEKTFEKEFKEVELKDDIENVPNIKFKAKRNNKNIDGNDEEII